jgi:hypothetical protein
MEALDREVLVMKSSQRRAVLLVVIDALPWELVRRTGFLDDLAAFRGPLKTVLGYSVAALPTLFSGVMPARHGHWAMYYHDPAGSPFKSYKPLLWLAHRFGGRGWTRRFIERTLPHTSSIKGYFKLYDIPLDLLPQYALVETSDIFSPGGLRSARSLFDILAERGIRYKVWTWRTPEAENFKDLFGALVDGRAQVFFFYTPELDAVMHATGVFSGETQAKLREQEAQVREAYRLAQGSYADVSLMVFSDHGMTDVEEAHDLMGYVKSRVDAEAPRDYLPFYDSTMARYWGNAGALEQISKALAGLDYGKVLGRTELEDLGLDFGHAAYGEIVFLLNPGHVVIPSFMGTDKPAAMHGFHPDDRSSFGTYISGRALQPEPLHIGDMMDFMIEAIDGLRPDVDPER